MTMTLKIAGACFIGLAITACSDDPYTPIVDGPHNVKFETDLAACRQVSQQRQKTKSGATGGAIIGGLIGGADASDGNEIDGAIAGAVIGGLIGSAEEGSEVDDARDRIVFNCMRGRGHKVVG